LRTAIHRLVGEVTGPYLEREGREIGEAYDCGVIPETEGQVVPQLFVEYDGTKSLLPQLYGGGTMML